MFREVHAANHNALPPMIVADSFGIVQQPVLLGGTNQSTIQRRQAAKNPSIGTERCCIHRIFAAGSGLH